MMDRNHAGTPVEHTACGGGLFLKHSATAPTYQPFERVQCACGAWARISPEVAARWELVVDLGPEDGDVYMLVQS